MTSRDNFSASDLSKDSNIERFTAWSKEIRLQGGSPSKDLPAELQQVQNLSQKFPSWIENDADSPPYSSLDPSFRSFVDTLRGTGSQVEDNDTNNSLEWALPSILQACWRMTRYATSGLPLGEADFKSIFDILMLDAIWHPRAEHSEWTQLS
ncbi:hypothetical protein FRC08_012739 [Ceratobasidium sp. 394]|nr:hypothetical protein FRC08_012739 [Ceratobasidium sp. 394]